MRAAAAAIPGWVASDSVSVMDGVECPRCGSTVPMRAQQTGGYGSRPNWIFEEHGAPDATACSASGMTVAEASED